MNWIDKVVRPKIRSFLHKRDVADNLWVKCPQSGEMIFHRDLEANQWVVPNSNYHMKIKSSDRLKSFFDAGEYEELDLPQVVQDPLKFRDLKRYSDRLKEHRNKTGMYDAVVLARGKLKAQEIIVAVQDFDFIAGSLSIAAGAAIVKGINVAIESKLPFVIFTASGGARMQEGILSLMQLPKITVAVKRLKRAGLPYIVVLTNPTTGGVTASYAMLGDVHIAEPGAQIGFAGARVIEQTIREKLPEGFQRSEYLLEHGMVDMVVHRHNLRDVISSLLLMFMGLPAVEKSTSIILADQQDAEPKEQPVSIDKDDGLLSSVPPEAAHAE
ncbi:MAG: acetyl-CoA carboxylase, carboxyltransferase subunit beta [Devosiaceae bacterium]|nr:acetyl-CoA carboxylase, carboxyltransferase subunit beta [Devosiaceae bacterium]